MRKVSRAKLRGKPLNPDCYMANTTTNEFGKSDYRVFCFGLYQDKTDDLRDECMNCKANVIYAEPLKRSDNNAEN